MNGSLHEQNLKLMEKNEQLRIERDFYERLFYTLAKTKIVAYEKSDIQSEDNT